MKNAVTNSSVDEIPYLQSDNSAFENGWKPRYGTMTFERDSGNVAT
jgi:hypothetical protein